MAAEAPISLDHVNHSYGSGELRKQILSDISLEIGAGEIVIVTGPSGSGKTTLLTLIGALRSAQEGSVRVLGEELRAAPARRLERVRRQVGYIFQAHNLIDALTSQENVEMALRLQPGISRAEVRRRAAAMLDSVGMGERKGHHPSQLSGGQRQRVAIARALAGEPRLVLADEPTASLDKQSGRDVVDLMQALAREQQVTVLLVTHDNRILDIADRIVHLEDGRLHSFADAVLENTRHLADLLAASQRKGELEQVVADLSTDEFVSLLGQVTEDARGFLDGMRHAEDTAFESMLEQATRAFTFKLARVLGAERASLFLIDDSTGELWLQVAQEEDGRAVELRLPRGRGVAGHVAESGNAVRIDDAYADSRFDPTGDRTSGFRTRSILCLPVRDRTDRVFAVAQLLNRQDGAPFDAEDEKRFAELVASLGAILESWWAIRSARHADPAEGA